MIIDRLVQQDIEEDLRRQAAVAIIGPRQVGKTTLALEIADKTEALYLDLESLADRQRLANQVLVMESVEDKLVILDEVHRVPELFQDLRGIIDQGRRNKKGKGRFLILGSASIDLLRQSGESLAGRISYIHMSPLTVLEIGSERKQQETLWLRGGFPDSYLADSDKDSMQVRRDFIRTYLERDIPIFGPRVPATTMERLWMMLANAQGTMLNASEMARALEVSTPSVTRYIDLLCDLLLVRRLPPYHANLNKRLVKSSKTYIQDSGLLHTLLNIDALDQLAGHPVVGRSWEGFVIETLLAVLPWGIRPYFYRTSAGAEVDLILEHPDMSLWAIEIKRGLSARLEKGFYQSIQDLKPARCFVVHAGADRYPLSETVEAIGLREMAQLLFELR